MEDRNIFQELSRTFQALDIPEVLKKIALNKLLQLQNQKLNIMVTGACGSGKSSTINAMFNSEVATIGVGVDPETMTITKYDKQNMVLWDTPGLGDGEKEDICHKENIIKKLNERDSKGNALIDLVLVILDGGSRDLGTSYELINSVILPQLEDKERILVAINQCDMAMKGKHWDSLNNKPDAVLTQFLDEKAESVRRRIREGTGVDIEPVYYSAGYKDGDEQRNPYNLSKLLYFIIQHTPERKRIIYADKISSDVTVWQGDDGLEDYGGKIQKSFIETIMECVDVGGDIGGDIGGVFGGVGEAVGTFTGAFVGTVVGVVKAFCNWW